MYFHQGTRAPIGPGPPNFRGFSITLRHTTLGRTPLDEWSARRRDLCLTTHKYPYLRWDSNPRSQHASDRRPTPWTAWPLGPAPLIFLDPIYRGKVRWIFPCCTPWRPVHVRVCCLLLEYGTNSDTTSQSFMLFFFLIGAIPMCSSKFMYITV